MLAIKLVSVDEHDLCRAASLAPHFVRRHPDSIGVRNGVIYTTDGFSNPLYVYRTKTQIVVRGRASHGE